MNEANNESNESNTSTEATDDTAKNESAYLFNENAANDQAQKNITEDNEQATWYIADGVPGTGERPEWLSTKFKTAEQLGKSYHELEKRFGGFTGSPEEYSLEAMTEKGVTPEAKYMDGFMQKAKAAGVSQEYFNDMVGDLAIFINETSPGINMEEEVKKLGENGQQQVDIMSNWAVNNLSETETETFASLCKTGGANAINLFNKMRTMAQPSVIPQAQGITQQARMTKGQLLKEAEENADKFLNDTAYRDNWRRRLQEVVGD